MRKGPKSRGQTHEIPRSGRHGHHLPQSLEASFRLWETVRTLAPLGPRFVSVTYGAGGTTRDLTHEAVATIHKHYGLNVAAHLTCVNASRAETLEIAERYHEAGVREIVALRGDAPKGQEKFTPTRRALPRASSWSRRWRSPADSRSGSAPIPKSTPKPRATPPISNSSSARSMPAPRARSPSSSSRRKPSSASAMPA